MTEQQAMEAIGRVDGVLAQKRIEPAMSRMDHLQLVQDINAIQEIVKESFKVAADLEAWQKSMEQDILKDDTDGRTDD